MCGLLHCPAVEMIIHHHHHHHHGSSHNLCKESASSYDETLQLIFTSSLLIHASPNDATLQDIWFSTALNFALLSLSLCLSCVQSLALTNTHYQDGVVQAVEPWRCSVFQCSFVRRVSSCPRRRPSEFMMCIYKSSICTVRFRSVKDWVLKC